MNIELTPEERDILGTLVSREVADLGPEIHHTRTRNYRDQLKRQKRVLERLLERLGLPAPVTDQANLEPSPESSETPETTDAASPAEPVAH